MSLSKTVALFNPLGQDTTPGVFIDEEEKRIWTDTSTADFDEMITNKGQEDVFTQIGQSYARKILSSDPESAVILAYGVTGAGKTFAVTGGARKFADRGLIPRGVSYIFEELGRQRSEDPNIVKKVYISFYEIYKDYVIDLLQEKSPKMRPRYHAGKLRDMEITQRNVLNESDAYHLLFQGDANRHFERFEENPETSRGHTFFNLSVEHVDQNHKEVTLSFVDLAAPLVSRSQASICIEKSLNDLYTAAKFMGDGQNELVEWDAMGPLTTCLRAELVESDIDILGLYCIKLDINGAATECDKWLEFTSDLSKILERKKLKKQQEAEKKAQADSRAIADQRTNPGNDLTESVSSSNPYYGGGERSGDRRYDDSPPDGDGGSLNGQFERPSPPVSSAMLQNRGLTGDLGYELSDPRARITTGPHCSLPVPPCQPKPVFNAEQGHVHGNTPPTRQVIPNQSDLSRQQSANRFEPAERGSYGPAIPKLSLDTMAPNKTRLPPRVPSNNDTTPLGVNTGLTQQPGSGTPFSFAQPQRESRFASLPLGNRIQMNPILNNGRAMSPMPQQFLNPIAARGAPALNYVSAYSDNATGSSPQQQFDSPGQANSKGTPNMGPNASLGYIVNPQGAASGFNTQQSILRNSETSPMGRRMDSGTIPKTRADISPFTRNTPTRPSAGLFVGNNPAGSSVKVDPPSPPRSPINKFYPHSPITLTRNLDNIAQSYPKRIQRPPLRSPSPIGFREQPFSRSTSPQPGQHPIKQGNAYGSMPLPANHPGLPPPMPTNMPTVTNPYVAQALLLNNSINSRQQSPINAPRTFQSGNFLMERANAYGVGTSSTSPPLYVGQS